MARFLAFAAYVAHAHAVAHLTPPTGSLAGAAASPAAASSIRMVAAERPSGKSSSRKRMKKEPPTIAVVGRPNVGKSTIANRMTQAFQRGGLVFDEPGVTRDRTYGYGFWQAHEFRVVDTGGLVFDDEEDRVFLPHIRQQAMIALGEAKSALLVVDGQQGCTPLDEEIAAFLRKQGVP